MKLAPTLLLSISAAGLLLANEASAQDARTVLLRFRKAGDTTVIVKGAQILVDHTEEAVTDSLGIARIPNLEDGGHIVEAVAKGYQAYFDNFVSNADSRMPIDLELRAFTAPPKPKGEATKLELSGFAARRTLAQGKFFTPAQLKAAEGRPLSNFLKVDAGAMIATGPNNESFLASRPAAGAPVPCYAAVVLDGLRVYPYETANPPDLDKTFTENLTSVELYSGAAPASLGVASKCGVLVLWTRTR